jgi:hypothetical protein
MHFVNCDGSAYFQIDEIDLELFAARATIAGNDGAASDVAPTGIR